MQKRIAIIDGNRTPFLKSGGAYIDLMSYQLGQQAIAGLLQKTKINPREIGYVVMGTTISNIKTGNVAREAALLAGVPPTSPCHTVTMACISANQAIVSALHVLQSGHADVAIAGGVDLVSDAPILFNKPMRKKLFKAQKLKGMGDILKFIFSLRLRDFMPETPAVAEFLTNRTMGYDCELLVQRYGISRIEQDEFAARSHQLASKAQAAGYFDSEITAVDTTGEKIFYDNGYRGDTTVEKIANLKPAFVKENGSITAANASFLTDGAACVLLMTEEKAKALQLTPKGYIHSYIFTGQSLEDELLLGPAYAVARLLQQQHLTLADIDVFEFHEAFAGQVLANLQCLASDSWIKEKLNLPKAIGKVPMEKLNLWGGSLSLGHPFGATGARLVTTACNRMRQEGGKRALIAACAAGAHGHAMILEKN